MKNQLEEEVYFLKVYAVVATLVCTVLYIVAFTSPMKKQKFDEIDVGRINIVEKDGTLRMVISNQEQQHPGIVNGKVIPRDNPRPPGIIFFNQLGDEMGGLIFGANGGDGHFGSLTFDKVRGDQAIGFRYLESDNGTYSTGLEVWQQPDVPGDVLRAKYAAIDTISDATAREAAIQKLRDDNEVTTRRLFVGKGRDNTASIEISDIKGRPRIKMTVAADGSPQLDFLDEFGNVTYKLP
jgi:hypothetical protein